MSKKLNVKIFALGRDEEKQRKDLVIFGI